MGFQEQIVFTDNTPRIKQSGLELLQSNHAGIQILNDSGQEIVSYQKPEDFRDSYSYRDLLEISETGHINDSGTTSFVGALEHNGKDYTYRSFSSKYSKGDDVYERRPVYSREASPLPVLRCYVFNHTYRRIYLRIPDHKHH